MRASLSACGRARCAARATSDASVPAAPSLGGGAVAGAAALAWAAGYEVRAFRLRRVEVPVLAPGQRPLRVLHLSDLHLMPGQRQEARVGARPGRPGAGPGRRHRRQPGSPEAVPAVLDALGPLLERPGAFVMRLQRLLRADAEEPGALPAARARRSGAAASAAAARGEDLRDGLRRRRLGRPGQRARPAQGRPPGDRAGRHRRRRTSAATATPRSPGPADAAADLSLAVTHAPYRRVLDPMTADGFRAGPGRPHPRRAAAACRGVGALVTNCDLPRRQAKGLVHADVRRASAVAGCTSPPGCGTSPYAPVRFACPPEATLLTLTPDETGGRRSARFDRLLG